MLLGDDLIPWLLLAMGAALVVGNVMALVRPPEQPRTKGELVRAPVGRSVVMIVIGLCAAIPALAALVAK